MKQLRMNKSHKNKINFPQLVESALCEHETTNPTAAISKTE